MSKKSETSKKHGKPWTVIDLFSGAGGMSCGFARRKPFKIVAAVDAEHAKPCEGYGSLGCNETYQRNIGIEPFNEDIGSIDTEEFLHRVKLKRGDLTVLICCPPCTDFSRAKPENHSVDTAKNSLVRKCADFVESLFPEFVLMENARELIDGNHPHHFRDFRSRLEKMGYIVQADVHKLTKFGLPQIRERALIIASRVSSVRTLEELWNGWKPASKAINVRHAIEHLPPIEAGEPNDEDPMHQSPDSAVSFDGELKLHLKTVDRGSILQNILSGKTYLLML